MFPRIIRAGRPQLVDGHALDCSLGADRHEAGVGTLPRERERLPRGETSPDRRRRRAGSRTAEAAPRSRSLGGASLAAELKAQVKSSF